MDAMPMCACGEYEIAPGYEVCDKCQTGTPYLPLDKLVIEIAQKWANNVDRDGLPSPSKIEAIKELRLRTLEYFPPRAIGRNLDGSVVFTQQRGAGLKDAKDMIDAVWYDLLPPYRSPGWVSDLYEVIDRVLSRV